VKNIASRNSTRDDGCEARARALADTRARLDEHRRRRRGRAAADDRADALDDERRLDAREVALLVGEVRLFARPVIVPIASKKFENSSVNTNMMSATTPTLPSRSRSHGADEAEVGDATMPPEKPKSRPNGQMALTIAASTVPPTRR
jgi:hypothetical protein